MKRKIFTSIGLLYCFLVCFTIIADLNGKWVGTIKNPDGESLNAIYTFKVDGNKLTGTLETSGGTVTVNDGKIEGDNFTFNVTFGDNVYPHTGKIYADSCGLDINFGGVKTHTTLKHSNN